jgi:hypothetical protein
MQNTQRAKQNTPEEQDKRKEKERKREEKELRKIAAAAGVRMAATSTTATLAPVVPSAESKPGGFKKGGWASISSATAEPSSSTESPPTRGGWGVVGSSSVPSVPSVSSYSSSPASDTISSAGLPTTTPLMPSQIGDPHIQEPTKEGQRQHHQPAPAFRTSGWTSIDTMTRVPPPPTPDPPDVHASAMTNAYRQPEDPPSAPSTPSVSETVPAVIPLPPPVPPHPQASIANPRAEAPKSSKSKKEREAEMRENSRSGWQSFQKGGRRK